MKRVPLDFDWPLNDTWPGYLMNGICAIMTEGRIADKYTIEENCERCRKFGEYMGWEIDGKCPDQPRLDPPEGDGYQLWETTSEGSPASPVFESAEELAEWCEENATVFAGFKATKDEWLKMFGEEFVRHEEKVGDTTVVFM